MSGAIVERDGELIEYVPVGEQKPIALSPEIVLQRCCNPTRSGKRPTEKDVRYFLSICVASRLNPFVGDAVLVGYDTKDGPQFSVITTIQSLRKRAEFHPHYDGIESGVVIQRKGGGPEYRSGALVLDGERLLGGWARVFRKDRKHPDMVVVSIGARIKDNAFWKQDPAGMIVKCAEAAALRKAFPAVMGQLYLSEEMSGQAVAPDAPATSAPDGESAVERLEKKVVAQEEEGKSSGGSIGEFAEISKKIEQCKTVEDTNRVLKQIMVSGLSDREKKGLAERVYVRRAEIKGVKA